MPKYVLSFETFLGMVGICESPEYLLSQDILLQLAETERNKRRQL